MLTSNASRSALPAALAVLAVIACSEESPSPDAWSDAGDAAAGQDAIPDAPADGPDAPADGPDAPADAASAASARSGSRLKARWSAAPDGRRLFRGWYDSLLATNCMFLPASDGVLRCLPGDTLLLEPAVYYGDSACTAPVVESGRTLPSQYFGLFSCTLPAFIRQNTQSGCNSSQARIFRRGPEVTGNTIFTKRPTPSCDPTFIVPGTAAFTLGEEVPATSFVKATRTPQPPAAGDLLQAIYLEAEDGARQLTGWQPVGGSENCRLLTLTDQRLHCMTATGRADSTFTDASCTEPAVYVSGCGPVPMFAEHPEPMTCPPVYSVRTVGQRLDRVYTTLYTGSCMETPSTRYYAQGNPVPIDTFPTVDETDDPAGRLRRRFRVGPGGLNMDTAWYDSDRATLCRPSLVGDKLRCIPEGPGLSIFFADSACDKPVAVAERRVCKPRFTFDYDRLACPLRTRAFEVGASHDGPVFELQTDRSQNPPRDSCLPVTERRPDYAYYQVKEIPEADLPELQSLVE